MKNKIIVMVLSMIMLMSLVGCSSKQEDKNTETSIEQNEDTEESDKTNNEREDNSENTQTEKQNFEGLNKENAVKETDKLKSAYGISTNDALLLIEEKYGKNGSIDAKFGNEISYVYEDIQEVDNIEYYNYKYSLLTYNENDQLDYISKVSNIFVSTDGSIVTLAEEKDGKWFLYNSKSDTVLIFNMKPSGKKDAISSLVLNKDYTFTFTYDAFSSYLPYGSFTISDNKIFCKTIDGLYEYVFDIVDDYNITFNETESSPIEMIDDSLEKPKDGSLFTSE